MVLGGGGVLMSEVPRYLGGHPRCRRHSVLAENRQGPLPIRSSQYISGPIPMRSSMVPSRYGPQYLGGPVTIWSSHHLGESLLHLDGLLDADRPENRQENLRQGFGSATPETDGISSHPRCSRHIQEPSSLPLDRTCVRG